MIDPVHSSGHIAHIPTLQGNIRTTLLSDMYEPGLTVLVEMDAVRNYKPCTYPFAISVTVREGIGLFHLDGADHLYRPGSVFQIPASAPHAFARVLKHTAFVLHAPHLLPFDPHNHDS